MFGNFLKHFNVRNILKYLEYLEYVDPLHGLVAKVKIAAQDGPVAEVGPAQGWTSARFQISNH